MKFTLVLFTWLLFKYFSRLGKLIEWSELITHECYHQCLLKTDVKLVCAVWSCIFSSFFHKCDFLIPYIFEYSLKVPKYIDYNCVLWIVPLLKFGWSVICGKGTPINISINHTFDHIILCSWLIYHWIIFFIFDLIIIFDYINGWHPCLTQ